MIYEYRAYYVMPGRMPDIQRRFADITMKLFKKHGINVVGFWETMFGESNEMVYICSYDDLAHRDRAWKAFMADPEWLAARKASEANGPLVERVVNKIWRPTSFSPLQWLVGSSGVTLGRDATSIGGTGPFRGPHLYINRRLARSSGGSRPSATSLASTYILYAARISALPTDLSPQRRNFGAFFESERPNMSSAAGYHLASSR